MEPTSIINLLVNLEYRRLTGHSAARANKDIEKVWSREVATRLNWWNHRMPTFDAHVLCEYISFLKYNESRSKYFTVEFEEDVANIIKQYLAYDDELDEYKVYCERFVSR
jgi:hypothetical protein